MANIFRASRTPSNGEKPRGLDGHNSAGRSLGRRILRFVGRSLLFFLLFLLVSVAGIVLWLRTDHASAFLTRTAAGVLAKQGFFLEVGAATGPLPSAFRLTDLRLSDSDGLFFRADAVELRLNLRELLQKRLHITTVHLVRPDLSRLPVLPPPAESSSAEMPAPEFSFATIPITLQLDSLRLEKARTAWALLGLEPNVAEPDKDASETAQSSTESGSVAATPAASAETENADGKDNNAAAAHRLAARMYEAPQQPLEIDLELAAMLKAGVLLTAAESTISAGEHLRLRLSLLPLTVALPQPKQLDAKANLRIAVDFDDQAQLIALSLNAEMRHSTARLSAFSFTGLGLGISAEAEADMQTLTAKADFSVAGEEHAFWQALAAEFGKLDPALIAATGNPLELKAAVSGGGNAPFTVRLDRLRAGILTASGLVTAGKDVPAAVFPATGATALIAETPAFGGKTDAVASAVNSDDSITIDLQAAVSDLAVLQPGMDGSVSMRVNVLADPRHAEGTVSVSSPALRTSAGALETLQAQLQGSFSSSAGDNALRADGRFTLSTEKAPGGPASVDTEFAAALSGASPEQKSGIATLRKLTVSGFGLQVTGDASARLAPAFFAQQTHAADLWPSGLAVDGKLSAAVRDWTHIAALSGMRIIGDFVTTDVALSTVGGAQQAKLTVNAPSLRLPDQGDLMLTGLIAETDLCFTQPQPTADVHVTTTSGRAGPLSWSAGEVTVAGNALSGFFSAALQQDQQAKKRSRVEPRTRRREKNKTPEAVAQSRDAGELVTIQGSYDLSKKEIALGTLFLHAPEGGPSVYLVKPVTATFAQGPAVKDFALAVTPGGDIKADIAVRPGFMQADIAVTSLPLAAIGELTGASVPDGYLSAVLAARTGSGGPTADLTAELRMRKPGRRFNKDSTGSAKTTTAELNAAAETAQANATATSGAPADVTLKASLVHSNGRLQLRGTTDIGPSARPAGDSARSAPVTFSIPMRLNEGGIPLPDMNGPLSAEVRWLGPVEPFLQLASMPDQTFSGDASVTLDVKGTPAAPKVSGAAHLARGFFEDRTQGILLNAVDAELTLQSNGEIRLAALVKDAAEGTFAAEGEAHTGGKTPSMRVRAQAKHFAPLHRDDLSIMFSGIFSLSGPLAELNITSSILVERGEVLLMSTLTGGSVPTLEISEPGADFTPGLSGPRCDLKIDIPRRFFIRGRGLDSEWQGNLHIGGRLSEPQLTGSLKPVRGWFDLLSKPFAFTGGDIAFAGGEQINPAVNLELTYNASNLEAIIRTSGTLKKFTLNLESRPPYPRDEVLAQVLFGKNVSELSRFEAVQLAAGVSELAGMGGGGLNPLTAVRKATGLDVLRVGGGNGQEQRQTSGMSGAAGNLTGSSQSSDGGDGDDAPSLEAGKYINDSIYIGVEQGVSPEDTAVRVEVELLPSINLQGRTSPASSQIGVGWKMDY